LILVTILLLTTAGAITLAEAGIHAVVQTPDTNKEWVIPYSPATDCNNIFVFSLIKGKAEIYDGNTLVLRADTPGKYRAILSNAGGTLKIRLIRNPGESNAEISNTSYVICDKVPILSTSLIYPPIFHAGGYDTLLFHVQNHGTVGTKYTIVLHIPDVVAPLTPQRVYKISPESEQNIIIPVTTADTFPQQLLPPQIITYADKHGEYTIKTEFGIIGSDEWVPLACIIHNKRYNLINIGTRPIDINGTTVSPGASITVGVLDENTAQHCVNTIKIQEMQKTAITDRRNLYVAIWAILGVLGVLMGEKEIKRSNA